MHGESSGNPMGVSFVVQYMYNIYLSHCFKVCLSLAHIIDKTKLNGSILVVNFCYYGQLYHTETVNHIIHISYMYNVIRCLCLVQWSIINLTSVPRMSVVT